MKKIGLRTALGLLVLLVLMGHATREFTLPFIAPIENLLYDLKIRQTMPGGVDPRIVIVDIDEASLAVPELGRWPWGRDKMALLINKLFDDYFVSIVGFDIVMAEADTSSGLKVLNQLGENEFKNNAQYLQTLQKLRPALDYDNQFSQSLRERRIVLGYYFTNDKDQAGSTGALPQPVLSASVAAGRDLLIPPWRSYGGNLPQMQSAALAGGHFNPEIDIDGSVRRAFLLAQYGGDYYEALSLAIVRALYNSPPVEPIFGDQGDYGAIESLRLSSKTGTLNIPVDKNSAALVPYRGARNSFKYISAADVLSGKVGIEQLADKIVLVGTSAPGLLDLRSTPVGSPFPGVEIHANLIAGMLDGSIKERPKFADATEAILLLVIGLLMIFLFPWKSPIKATLATILALGVVVAVNMALWLKLNWVVGLAPGLLMVGLLFVINMSLGYFLESKAKKQFTQLFGQYVPPELVVEMSRDPERYTMSGRRKELTVLFSDVRGFTTISEGMPPEALAQLMNEYLGAMTIVIRKHGGTLDKYIGDAIMAFWGAPVENANHARAAVLSAMEMLVALDELNVTLAARGTAPMKIGIGINTGPMTVGDMGSQIRLAYTVMGDAVNLGARLEGKTKDYGIALMVGQATMQAVPEVVFRELDCVQVKGKDEPITTYEPMGMVGQIAPALQQELDLWTKALAAYRQQDWDGAEALIAEIRQTNPEHKLYHLYLERIAEFRLNPPGPEWTGVMRFDTK